MQAPPLASAHVPTIADPPRLHLYRPRQQPRIQHGWPMLHDRGPGARRGRNSRLHDLPQLFRQRRHVPGPKARRRRRSRPRHARGHWRGPQRQRRQQRQRILRQQPPTGAPAPGRAEGGRRGRERQLGFWRVQPSQRRLCSRGSAIEQCFFFGSGGGGKASSPQVFWSFVVCNASFFLCLPSRAGHATVSSLPVLPSRCRLDDLLNLFDSSPETCSTRANCEDRKARKTRKYEYGMLLNNAFTMSFYETAP